MGEALRLRREVALVALAVPGLLYFLVFQYLPLLGYVIAFQDYIPIFGLFEGTFVGLRNFERMLGDPTVWSAARNTVVIAVVQLLLFFPIPIGVALVLSSVTSTALRRVIQNIVYLPHFISWVIVIALFQEMFGGAGLVSRLAQQLGGPVVNLMANASTFPLLVTFQVVWREAGWAAIIYMAALLSVDPALYEAAAVDGANRWGRLWHITLPGLMGITVVLLILRLGNILTVGFEQILLQRDSVGYEAGEVLDTWVYFHGVLGGEWSVAAVAGLVKGIFATVILLTANRLAHRLGSAGLYQ